MGCFICKIAAPVDNTNRRESRFTNLVARCCSRKGPGLTESDRTFHQGSFARHQLKGEWSLPDGTETPKSDSEAEGNGDESNTVFVLDDVDATQSLDVLKDAVVEISSISIVEFGVLHLLAAAGLDQFFKKVVESFGNDLDLTKETKDGKTALQLAMEYNHPNCISVLKSVTKSAKNREQTYTTCISIQNDDRVAIQGQ